eukprot:353298-Chlamydomonas_euryale.AAC.2
MQHAMRARHAWLAQAQVQGTQAATLPLTLANTTSFQMPCTSRQHGSLPHLAPAVKGAAASPSASLPPHQSRGPAHTCRAHLGSMSDAPAAPAAIRASASLPLPPALPPSEQERRMHAIITTTSDTCMHPTPSLHLRPSLPG